MTAAFALVTKVRGCGGLLPVYRHWWQHTTTYIHTRTNEHTHTLTHQKSERTQLLARFFSQPPCFACTGACFDFYFNTTFLFPPTYYFRVKCISVVPSHHHHHHHHQNRYTTFLKWCGDEYQFSVILPLSVFITIVKREFLPLLTS